MKYAQQTIQYTTNLKVEGGGAYMWMKTSYFLMLLEVMKQRTQSAQG
jgi:hypothetical protein